MIFHSCEKQVFKSFDCTKIRSVWKWTKLSQNEVIQRTANNNTDSKPIFPYHVHNQAGFDDRITSTFRGWVSLFKYLQEFKVAYQ